MKNQLIVIGTLILSMGFFAGNMHTIAADNEFSDYYSVIQNTNQEIKNAYEWAEGYGALFDIDGNDTEELIMLYTTVADAGFPMTAYSVYTMENDAVVPIIKDSILFTMAGGAQGSLNVIRENGNILLAEFSEYYETGTEESGDIQTGYWDLYSVNGTEFVPQTSVQYVCMTKMADGQWQTIYDESSCTINGEDCSYEDYEAWLNEIDVLLSVSSYESENVMPLDKLAEYVNGTADNSKDILVSPGWAEQYYDFIINDRMTATDQENWDYVSYELIYLDEDSVPELWIDYQTEAAGCRLGWITEDEVKSSLMSTGYLTFKENDNLFLYSYGKQGVYGDQIYSLIDEELQDMGKGEYEIYTPEYKWEEMVVPEEVYKAHLEEVKTGENIKYTSVEESVRYSYDEVLDYLNVM